VGEVAFAMSDPRKRQICIRILVGLLRHVYCGTSSVSSTSARLKLNRKAEPRFELKDLYGD